MTQLKLAFMLVVVLALSAASVAATLGSFNQTNSSSTAYGKEVNSAHDADNGLGNEKSFGTCKQEANNDNACHH